MSEVPDGKRIRGFERTFRETVAKEMRDDGADDATIAAAMRNVRGSIVWARHAEQTEGTKRTTVDEYGATPATGANLSRVTRELSGLPPTRPSEQDERIATIVQAVVAGAETRRAAAVATGRVDEWGVEQSDFKRDVREAGGWKAIRRRAGKI